MKFRACMHRCYRALWNKIVFFNLDQKLVANNFIRADAFMFVCWYSEQPFAFSIIIMPIYDNWALSPHFFAFLDIQILCPANQIVTAPTGKSSGKSYAVRDKKEEEEETHLISFPRLFAPLSLSLVQILSYDRNFSVPLRVFFVSSRHRL